MPFLNEPIRHVSRYDNNGQLPSSLALQTRRLGPNHENNELSNPGDPGRNLLFELGSSEFKDLILMLDLGIHRAQKSRASQGFGIVFAILVLAGCATSAPSRVDATVAKTALGEVIVDGKGMTAYFYDKDKPDSGSSACTGQCATTWPAITSTAAAPAVSRIGGTVGTIVGVNGGKQLTVNGRPIYTYVNDRSVGDVNGQGIFGIWYAVSPSGSEIKSVVKPKSAGKSGY